MNKQKGQAIIFILVGILVLVGVIGGAYYLGKTIQKSPQPPTSVVTSVTPKPVPTVSVSPTASPESSASAETTNWKTYTNNEFHFSFQYPSNLKLIESKQTSRSNFTDKVTFIGLSITNNSGFTISLEPNPKQLTLDQWLSEQIKQEKENCEIDCQGFSSSPTTKITIAKQEVILQNLGSVVSSVNIYLPLNKDTIIWASAVNIPKMTSTKEEKNLLISILNTIRI